MLVGLLIFTFGATSASLFGFDLGFPIVELVNVKGGESRRDLCVRWPAGLLELWFLGDLLGIFWVSEVVLFFLYVFGVVIFMSLAFGFGVSSIFGLWSLGVLDGMRYCG